MEVGGLVLTLLVAAVPITALASLLHPDAVRRAAGWPRRVRRRLPGAGPEVVAEVVERPLRPIEDVAHDVRRLARRFHDPAPGIRHAKLEGLRRAYDGALGEACTTLDVEHLLAVLAAGPDLDVERRRVERALAAAGLALEPDDASGR